MPDTETVNVVDAPVATSAVVAPSDTDASPAQESSDETPEQRLERSFEQSLRESTAESNESAAGKDTAVLPAGEKESAAVDDLPEELPTDTKAANEAWKRHRLALKELQSKLKPAEQQAAVAETSPVADPDAPIPAWIDQQQAQPPKPQAKPEPITPDKVPTPFLLEVLARHAGGEEGIDSAVEAAKEQLQNRATPKELLEIMGNARRGGYGKLSADIADLCREWLPVVQAGMDERRQQQAIAYETTARYKQSWQEAKKALPGLHDANSPDAKEFLAASKELSETFGVNGPFFRAVPNAPSIVAHYIGLTRAAARVQQLETHLATMREENVKLKRRLGIAESPQSSRQPVSAGQRKQSAEERLAEVLRAAGVDV